MFREEDCATSQVPHETSAARAALPVDLCFAVRGDPVPRDHGYALFSAMSRVLGPILHGADWIGIHPLRGVPCGPDGRLDPTALVARVARAHTHELLPLIGVELPLVVRGRCATVGVPHGPTVQELVPAPTLRARVNFAKHAPPTVAQVQRQLDELGVRGTIRLGAAWCMRVAEGTAHVAPLTVSQLSDEDSLILQSLGLGGRRRFGCGVFVPVARAPSPVPARRGAAARDLRAKLRGGGDG